MNQAPGRHRHQRGQTLVLVAGAIVAIVAMLALVLMGGLAYWQRRHLQEIADAGALAGSVKATGACNLAQAASVAGIARPILEAHLGVSSMSAPSGSCATGGYQYTFSFGNGATATLTWPYRSLSQVDVVVGQTTSFMFPSITGGAALIRAEAVARNAGAGAPGNFAIYAYSNIPCQGSGTTVVNGSIYAGGTIDNTQCGWYAKEIRNSSGLLVDAGNILVHGNQPGWYQGQPSCNPTNPSKQGHSICSDGYEISNGSCGTIYGSPGGGTEYISAQQLTSGENPNPCGATVPPPQWVLTPSPNAGDEPNFGSSAQAKGYGPCPVDSTGALVNDVTYTIRNISGTQAVARARVAPPGQVKDPDVGSDNVVHFYPGCYAWIDLANIPLDPVTGERRAVLEPGFYHFNGFVAPKDPKEVTVGGIALGSGNARLLGQDVTLEFANPNNATWASSFSGSSTLIAGTTLSGDTRASCGSPCSVGADPASPIAVKQQGNSSVSYSYFSAPCSSSDTGVNGQKCPTPGSSWCSSSDPSCWNVLSWAPPPTPTVYGGPNPMPWGWHGSFTLKGSSSFAWMYGILQFPGPCIWDANGSSTLIGRLVCDTVKVQGGSVSPGPEVSFGGTSNPSNLAEPALVK